jgi:membrane peptidoglycan carboxypeptidase
LRICAAAFTLLVVFLVSFCVVTYINTPLPTKPQDGVTDQGSVVYFSDRDTQVLRLGANRQLVTHDQIPDLVRNAVLAAEDRNFYHEPGISPSGIVRAAWADLTGSDVQGASTITQQLARNYYQGLSRQRSVSRKFKEIFISLKLGNRKSKDEILDLYLNTVFFGRQSSGVQAAARAYFHTDVWKLNIAQAALLAAMIQQPSYFRTQGDDPAALALRKRWQYVIDGLVKMKKLTRQQAAAIQFPATYVDWDDTSDDGQLPFIEQELNAELRQLNISDQELSTAGLKIYTGLDKNAMDAAAHAMQSAQISSWPKGIYGGLVALDPQTGAIRAMYGGDPKQGAYDTLFSADAQVGSTFKPYVLATALKQGYTVNSTIDGRSPERFAPNGQLTPLSTPGYLVKNDQKIGSQRLVSLVKATALSVNTSFVRLAFAVGLDNVMKTAESFGVPDSDLKPYKGQAGIALGEATIPAVTQAAAYAVFANGGTTVTPHLITKVVDSHGHSLPLPWIKPGHRVLTPEQAAQATYAMRAVVTGDGTGTAAAVPGHDVAGKTGTSDNNHAIWFVGYSAQLTAAVTVFNTRPGPVQGIPGYSGVQDGGGVPSRIWHDFMAAVLQSQPDQPFPTPAFSGRTTSWDSSLTTGQPSQPKQSTHPSATPTYTPHPPCIPVPPKRCIPIGRQQGKPHS